MVFGNCEGEFRIVVESRRVSWQNLSTVKFAEAMRPHAVAIYEQQFRDCTYVPTPRISDEEPHPDDRDRSIDAKIVMPYTDNAVTIQEKYRKYRDDLDITFEVRNGDGSPGEWYHLESQLYFIGIAEPDLSGFKHWAILDVFRMVMTVNKHGGLEVVGKEYTNDEYGASTFRAVPLHIFHEAVVASNIPGLSHEPVRHLPR